MSKTGEIPTCPLCLRLILAGVPQSLHHLVPKLRGGKGGPTVLLHDICHREIHATLTETELSRDFDSIAQLQKHPRLQKFVEWVQKRPPEFQSRVPGKHRKR